MINYADFKLKKENVLYLPIKRVHFDRILNGTKRLEFRAETVHYYRRLLNLNPDGTVIDEKPINAILFSAGYSKDVPRMLIELFDWFINDPEYRKKEGLKSREEYRKDFENDGLDIDNDEVLVFVLGKVLATENMK